MARSILTLKPFPSSVIKGGNGSNPTLITSAYNDVKENIKPQLKIDIIFFMMTSFSLIKNNYMFY
jgi:hypothetical protein